MTQTSVVETIPSIAGCIAAAETTFGINKFVPVTAVQVDNFHRIESMVPQLGQLFNAAELATLATESSTAMEEFFKAKNFDVKIPTYLEGDLGLGAVLKLALKWFVPGKPFEISHGLNPYEGVKLTDKHNPIEFYEAIGHNHPIAAISVENGDEIHVTKFHGNVKSSPFALTWLAEQFATARRPIRDFDSVALPMLDLEVSSDLGWLEGMRAVGTNGNRHISKASQENRLRLNLEGALAESATHMTLTLGITALKKTMILDEPFLFWIQRLGVSTPLFTAFVTPDSWKNPGELSF